MRITLYLITFSSILFSCSHAKNTNQEQKKNNIFVHAKNIYSESGSNIFTVYLNWENQTDSITYILHKGEFDNAKSTANKQYIKVPISSVAALSTTHIAMIHELKKTATITGICDHFRMSNPYLWQKYKNNNLIDLGTSMDVNQELLIELSPNAVLKTAFSKTDLKKDELLHKIGLPIIYTYSWHEQTPLARAEWIKFIGALYDIPKEADSIFSNIESNYTTYKLLVDTIKQKPKVLAGDMVKDIWYMPGGQSYIATYLHDAGADYIFKNSHETGSLPLHFENVLEKSEKAMFWIGADANTYEELYLKDSRYKLLSVCKNMSCYNHNVLCNSSGGNDYWETGYIRPDIILADLITIFHPNILKDHELVFYKKIE